MRCGERPFSFSRSLVQVKAGAVRLASYLCPEGSAKSVACASLHSEP